MKKTCFAIIALVMFVVQTSAQKSVRVCTDKDWDVALSADKKTVILNYSGNRRVKNVKLKKIHSFTIGFDKDNKPLKAAFSHGNLQYNPAPSDGESNYRFAKFQWQKCFKHVEGATMIFDVGEEHKKWLDDDGKPQWTDLFGWGMWLNSEKINPLITSSEAEKNYLPKITNSILEGATAMGGDWRLPSFNEFKTLLGDGNIRSGKHLFATVNDIEGLVILPDDWSIPFDAGDWDKMEQYGAIFLPAAGWRNDTENNEVKYALTGDLIKKFCPEAESRHYWGPYVTYINGKLGWVVCPGDWTEENTGIDEYYYSASFETVIDRTSLKTVPSDIWEKMVHLGARFIPIDEIPIDETNLSRFVDKINVEGYYWTSEALEACCAANISFSAEKDVIFENNTRDIGMAVRMIKPLTGAKVIDIPDDVAANPGYIDGMVFQNAGTKVWSFAYTFDSDYEMTVEYEDMEAEVLPQTAVYNGGEFKPSVTVKAGGKEVPATEYSLVYPEDVINAGDKTVNITNISNNAGGVMKEFTVNYQILPKEITVNAEAKSKTYGENDPEFTFTVDGLIGSDNLSGVLSREEGENVGSYAIKQGTVTANDNYTIVFSGKDLTILPKETPIVWGKTDFVYNGNEQSPSATLSGLIDGDVCTVTVSGAQINAGTYTATATALSNSNYKLSENSTTQFTIRKADPVIIAPESVSGLVFNNKPHTLITAGSTNGGTLRYKILNQEFSETLPQAVNVGDYVVDYYVEGNENFNSTEAASVTAHIEKSEIPVADEERILCNADGFCNGKAKLSYLIVFGDVRSYTLAFDNAEISTQKGEILEPEGEFEFELPNTLKPGKYSGSVVFTDNIGKDSEVYPFDFEVTNLFGIIKQLYYNTLCVDNKDGQFTSYQWTNNGGNLSGEVYQYLHLNSALSGVYTVWAESDGKRMESCPFEAKNMVSKKKSDLGINVYPNPALEAQEFTVEVLNFDPDGKYEIIITNDFGRIVKRVSNVQQMNNLALKKGNYTGILLTNGEKTAFKIIVK